MVTNMLKKMDDKMKYAIKETEFTEKNKQTTLKFENCKM